MVRLGTDYVGTRFCRLVVLAEAQPVIRSYPGRSTHKTRMVKCLCDCGVVSTVDLAVVRKGKSKSCGCLRREITGDEHRKHGEANCTSEHSTWKGMKQRCYNPKNLDFKYYGGRGISVCARWRDDFSAFLADMGRRPSDAHSIDRRDNDGNYEPGNCHWATPKEQSLNRRPRSC